MRSDTFTCPLWVAEITPGGIGPGLGIQGLLFFVATLFAAPDFGFGQAGQAAASTAGQAWNALAEPVAGRVTAWAC